MKYIKGKITKLLVEYFDNDFKRIIHALDVLKYCEKIIEEIDNYDYDIIVAVALLHDVGIKKSEEVLGYNTGKTQEKYGPDIARILLKTINFPTSKMEIVCDIIGNHHSKSKYDYIELDILKKADKIVNKKESEDNKNEF